MIGAFYFFYCYPLLTVWSVIHNGLIYAAVAIGNKGFINEPMHFEATFKTFRDGIALHACRACVRIMSSVTFVFFWFPTFSLCKITFCAIFIAYTYKENFFRMVTNYGSNTGKRVVSVAIRSLHPTSVCYNGYIYGIPFITSFLSRASCFSASPAIFIFSMAVFLKSSTKFSLYFI